MKLIVGLGNPGMEYEGTRHNVGFMVVDNLAARLGLKVTKVQGYALTAEGRFGEERVVLAKPQTFVNNSGQAVRALKDWFKLDLGDILVICDDMNLPLGRLRIKGKGSAGGHNGLKSVIAHMDSESFSRLRVGINHPQGEPSSTGAEHQEIINHVLGRFSRAETKVIAEAVERAADAVETFVVEGLERTMNLFNRQVRPDQSVTKAGKDEL